MFDTALEAELAGTKDELYSVDKAAKELGERVAALEAEVTRLTGWRDSLQADFEAASLRVVKAENRVAQLEAALREAMDLMHKDLAAYKSEMPSVTAEMEAFLDRYESETKGEQP